MQLSEEKGNETLSSSGGSVGVNGGAALPPRDGGGGGVRITDSPNDSDSDDVIDAIISGGDVSSIPKTGAPKGSITRDSDLASVLNLDKLHIQCQELMNPEFKKARNKSLAKKLLDLDEANITPKMVEFMCSEGFLETLIEHITLLGTGSPRPAPSDSDMEILKQGYKSTLLLSPKDTSESFILILNKKCASLTAMLFDIFRDDSAGSFYHFFRIIETFFKYNALETLQGISLAGKGVDRISSMLRYIGFSPVNEIVSLIISQTISFPRNSSPSSASNVPQKSLFEELSEWGLLPAIIETIIKPDTMCMCASYCNADQHSSAATDLLQDLVEQLSAKDCGEMMLRPIGENTEHLDKLIDCACNEHATEGYRINSCKILCFLLRRAADPEIVSLQVPTPGSPPLQTIVPNRLNPFRERIVLHIEDNLDSVFTALSRFKTNVSQPGGVGAVDYPGHKIHVPFGTLRVGLIELLVLMVESDEAVTSCIPLELWKSLCAWTIDYAFNSLYHSLFYRLIFSLLRQGQEEAQKNLFDSTDFVSFLCENYIPFPMQREQVPSKRADPLILHRCAARGLVMNCFNAIRLQADSQAPNTFLRSFLETSEKWSAFMPVVLDDTIRHTRFGMGIKITDLKNPNSGALQHLIGDGKEDANHGSPYAKTLGFYDTQTYSGN